MDNLPINGLDLVVIIIVLISAVLALLRGFVKEVLGILAIVGAGFSTLWLFTPARTFARQYIEAALLADIRATAALGDLALVEGVGGFRVPLTDGWDTADLAVDLGLPVILVVGKREAEENSVAIRQLGSTSQEVLALEDAIRKLGIEACPPHKRGAQDVAANSQDRIHVAVN